MVGSRVYVGGLSHSTTERDLERFFRGYGRMKDVLLKNGYGFVEFDDYRDADDAVYELNGKKLLGERVTVERARGTPRGRDQWSSTSRNNDQHRGNERYGPPTRTNYRVIIENLSTRVSWQDLKDYMRQAGEVTYADAHKQRRNEGVVEFASLSDMKTAIEKFDGKDLNGRRIRVSEDRGSKRKRSRGSNSSRSRSRSRSAKRSRSHSSRSKSKSKSHSRSASPNKKDRTKVSKSKSRSRSISRDKKSNDRSPSNSRKKSVGRDRSNTPKKSDSRDRLRSTSGEKSNNHNSRSGSRRKSPERSRSRSRSQEKRSKSRSRSGSLEKRSRSRSREQSKGRSRSVSKSRSRSRSGSAN